MKNKLEQLKTMTTVVADTGDLEAIKKWRPEDATTNPSLLLKAASLKNYQPLLIQAIQYGQAKSDDEKKQVADASDFLAVAIGKEILKYIPGRVSTEVDARLSFDTQATIDKAQRLVDLYAERGITRNRVLIKVAATWEGIRAAEQLEKNGIQCNLTLLFGMAQARAAAEAGVFLISPFVGRILDWYKASTGKTDYPPGEDPGVLSVSNIYNFYKKSGFNTVIMGASFRNTGEIEQLAGCDRLTISPDLLAQLAEDDGALVRRLKPCVQTVSPKQKLPEAKFRWQFNEDAMATEKLAEGIRKFSIDQLTLEALLKDRAGKKHLD